MAKEGEVLEVYCKKADKGMLAGEGSCVDVMMSRSRNPRNHSLMMRLDLEYYVCHCECLLELREGGARRRALNAVFCCIEIE